MTDKKTSQEQIAAGVAHDMNYILGLVKNYSQFLIRDAVKYNSVDHPVVAEDFGVICQAIEQGESLMRQLMALTYTGSIAPPQVFNLNEIIADILPMLHSLPVQINYELSPDLWEIKADPSQIQQVLMNLTLNAADAINNGGTITVATENRVTDRIPFVCLQVVDNGCGMTKKVKAQALDPYYTTKGYRGTGLGLSTVNGIVTNCGGTIDIDSTENEGTTISVTLPAGFRLTRS